jgi:hypothetical protein
MQLLTFDIFSGVFEQDAMWIEAVQGLDHATKRMEEIVSAKPGEYFVFCSATHAVVASTDGSGKLDSAAEAGQASS